MKKLFKLLILSAAVVVSSSCSDDYLDTVPTDSTGTGTIFENVTNMEMAVNGLYKRMVIQYSNFTTGFNNGEALMKMWCGDLAGNNMSVMNYGNVGLQSNTYHTDPTSMWVRYPWMYYYGIISNANAIIEFGPDAEGSEDRKQYLMAQAKVMRAYCYMMLSQRFHYRWSMGKSSEAANGNGLVMRLTTSSESLPLVSADVTYAQIEKDLKEGIEVLEKEAYKRNQKEENYQINKDVAYAIYARAALIKGDYTTSLTYAQKARKDYPLMSNEEYFSGFSTPNSEWIWSSFGKETESLSVGSFFGFMAYNASSAEIKYRGRYISNFLYEQIPTTDIRRRMFLDPEDMEYSKSTGKVTEGSPLWIKAHEMYPDLPEVNPITAWYNFKFKCIDNIGVGHLNHFRSSEMVLIEAECQHKLGNDLAAQALLEELIKNTGRDPEYTCDKIGEDLFEEIKLYRAIELWGEGFEWYDLKRWNGKVDRKSFADGGNSAARYAVSSEQNEDNNWWTSMLPRQETDYNTEI